MAEDCKICFKEETFKRIAEESLEHKVNIKEITKIVSDIKDGHLETKYSLRDIKKNQDDMSVMALAEKLKREAKEEEAIKAKAVVDAESLKEKRSTRRSIWGAVIVLAINTIVGVLVKHPEWFN